MTEKKKGREREVGVKENMLVKTAREEQGKLCNFSYINMTQTSLSTLY